MDKIKSSQTKTKKGKLPPTEKLNATHESSILPISRHPRIPTVEHCLRMNTCNY